MPAHLLFMVCCLVFLSLSANASAPSYQETPFVGRNHAPRTRPFHLGFTPWPMDLTPEGVETARAFAETHGDMISLMFIGGIPWQEALDNKPFSADVQSHLNYKRPPGKKLFLSISPLNQKRDGLAPYWGEKDNQPLPPPWDNYPLHHPSVKKAYRAFVLKAVAALKPEYLAIGIELNVQLSKNPARWQQLKELYIETYRAVKARYPRLLVCFTTEVIHYKKLTDEAKGKDQAGEVAGLMKYSDVFSMSFYPHMTYGIPRPVPGDFLDFARAFHKPIAVTESGMTSRNVELKSLNLTLYGSEADQKQFMEFLLRTALRDRYLFVINFASTDFEKLVEKIPPPDDDVARIWAYTGLQTSDKRPKPALAVWERYRALPYRR